MINCTALNINKGCHNITLRFIIIMAIMISIETIYLTNNAVSQIHP